MRKHRNPRPRLPKRPSPDNSAQARARAEDPPTGGLVHPIDEVRRLMGRADALAAVIEEQFRNVVAAWDANDRIGLRRLANLVELTAATVTAAHGASYKLVEIVERMLPRECE